MLLSARYDEAVAFTLELHRKQVRKGSNAPYATHLLSVPAMIGEYGGDEEQMIAGLLHDSIEDQGMTEAELSRRFGARVARLVVACTDSFETPKPPWRARKEQYIAHLRRQPDEVKLVSACDKLHNARSIDRDRARPEVGEAIWGRFSVEKAQTLWYYRALHEALAEGWPHPILVELDRVVTRLGG